MWFCAHTTDICLENVSGPLILSAQWGKKQEVRVSQTYVVTMYCMSILFTYEEAANKIRKKISFFLKHKTIIAAIFSTNFGPNNKTRI